MTDVRIKNSLQLAFSTDIRRQVTPEIAAGSPMKQNVASRQGLFATATGPDVQREHVTDNSYCSNSQRPTLEWNALNDKRYHAEPYRPDHYGYITSPLKKSYFRRPCREVPSDIAETFSPHVVRDESRYQSPVISPSDIFQNDLNAPQSVDRSSQSAFHSLNVNFECTSKHTGPLCQCGHPHDNPINHENESRLDIHSLSFGCAHDPSRLFHLMLETSRLGNRIDVDHGVGHGVEGDPEVFRYNIVLDEYPQVKAGTSAGISDTARAESGVNIQGQGEAVVVDFGRPYTDLIKITRGKSGRANPLLPRILIHPLYSELLKAHLECRKVGSSPTTCASMEEMRKTLLAVPYNAPNFPPLAQESCNPQLDAFMADYIDRLGVYRRVLEKPFLDAQEFCREFEDKLALFSKSALRAQGGGDTCTTTDPIRSHGDTVSDGSEERPAIDPCADGAELKAQLRKHYGGYLSGVKQEHLRKRKKGKLPAEATIALHKWWKGHYKWPYPSEIEKAELGESTGLDLKQIANWFINQRKRHWSHNPTKREPRGRDAGSESPSGD